MTAPPNEQPHAPDVAQNSRSKSLWWLTAGFALVAFCWLLYWLCYLQYHESTDDAYANGNMITINSSIGGSVVAFFADDTDLVTEGQLLVQLDPTAYQVAYDRELATLAEVVLQVRQLYDTVQVQYAHVESMKMVLANAKVDYDNRLKVVDSGGVAREDFIHSQNTLYKAEADLQQAKFELKVALDAAGNTPPEIHPLIDQQKENVRQAYYDLYHTNIYAPTTGYVAQRTVNVGQWAAPNTAMLAVIPADYVWVDANFKETQLTYMRIGQPATVWFDLYGSKVSYEGKVLGIASGSGSVFSLIPPQNATGNWIKIVQRLPVRISLDPQTVLKYPTRLGISATVDVDITNQELPRLAQIPPTKPVAQTTVFDIHLERVNTIIDNVISQNIKKVE